MSVDMQTAERLGVALHYKAVGGQVRQVPADTVAILTRVLQDGPAPADRPRAADDPVRAFLPAELTQGGRVWGLSLQLYALRSARNWGIGDFTDLAAVMGWASALGARYVGLNPLHAPFLAQPHRCSPYDPCSRLALNPLYIDPMAVTEAPADLSRSLAGAIAQARSGALVDYPTVAAAKRAAFDRLFERFTCLAPATRQAAFARFRQDAGPDLETHCLFEALHEAFAAEGREGGFPAWPDAYRRPDSPEVRQFRAEKADRIAFFAYLQWLARQQLEAAVTAGRSGCGGTELYLDLAVGASGDGSEVWAGQDHIARGVRLGAPPDALSSQGQDWGLPPIHPGRLATAGFDPLRRILRASMAVAGALRIDHVLGFNRQFWIPEGRPAKDGGYVAFPQADMIAATAQESRAAGCLVVGEDLGTVPEGLTDALHAANILSYEIACWARDADGAMLPPDKLPRLCLAVASTHDMPPVLGWLQAADIEARDRLGLYDSRAEADEARAVRKAEAADLLAAWGVEADAPPAEIVEAGLAFLARSRAAVILAPLDDLLLETEQMNLPGTVDAYPNWRRRYGRDLADWTADPAIASRARWAVRR